MGRHISKEQDMAIIERLNAGADTIEISKELGIPHRTVKERIGRDKPKERSTNLKGNRLYCLQELGRLLCWPAPKLAESLDKYLPNIHKVPININPAIPRKRAKRKIGAKGLVSDRTVQRYLNEAGVMENVRKTWTVGEVAAHAAKLVWWEHDQIAESKVVRPGENSREVKGWLLVIADRALKNAKDTRARELNVKFQLFTGDCLDTDQAALSLSHAICNQFANMTTLHLVSDEQGHPTVGCEAEKLRSVDARIEIVVDKPTSVKGMIEIKASFPNRDSVENFLAVILAKKNGTPNFTNTKWQEFYDSISDDNYCIANLGASWPFLSRPIPI